ncbi:endonuclease [Marinobacter daepoensis]|uniref:Endonuclease n=1 Tax=Marinobacter daepoensis TaxID=262077 RepID=A0ABS3BI27_9GAMM|nr:endonuclease [Marinobacter daepoensis]MBN7771163.1 endonuclease [Marinobacter daepoensis]MBY6079025.1 endonuclease [Marinobacter daepoensis]
MKKITTLFITLSMTLTTGLVVGQNTRFSDPQQVIDNEFWGNLYAEGGSSFFCDTAFSGKGFVMSDGYIYPLADIRTALDCGTASQCRQDNRYRQITSDLHNMVPVRTRIEMRRRNARYENLGDTTGADECGIRESAQFFEPPERVKGDVARTMAYMVDTYGLPWLGATPVLKGWSKLDPPDDRELSRHKRVAEIQGNENPFVVNPGLIERL